MICIFYQFDSCLLKAFLNQHSLTQHT